MLSCSSESASAVGELTSLETSYERKSALYATPGHHVTRTLLWTDIVTDTWNPLDSTANSWNSFSARYILLAYSSSPWLPSCSPLSSLYAEDPWNVKVRSGFLSENAELRTVSRASNVSIDSCELRAIFLFPSSRSEDVGIGRSKTYGRSLHIQWKMEVAASSLALKVVANGLFPTLSSRWRDSLGDDDLAMIVIAKGNYFMPRWVFTKSRSTVYLLCVAVERIPVVFRACLRVTNVHDVHRPQSRCSWHD